MRLPLHNDWRYILMHSASVGVHVVTGVCLAAQVAIPVFFAVEPPLWLGIAGALAALIGGPLSRVYHQSTFTADGAPATGEATHD